MRRLCADREEKRVTRGSDISGQDGEQEQLDLNDPNQRSLLEQQPFDTETLTRLQRAISGPHSLAEFVTNLRRKKVRLLPLYTAIEIMPRCADRLVGAKRRRSYLATTLTATSPNAA